MPASQGAAGCKTGILSNAQVKTNFELIDSLIKISANEISKKINVDESYKLNYKSAEEYSVLENTVIKYIQENKISIGNNNNVLNFSLEEAKIYYPEMFRDGLFGEYLIDRTAEIRAYCKSTSTGICFSLVQHL